MNENMPRAEIRAKKKKEYSRSEIAARSILKTYRREIWAPFISAVKQYELIEKGDRIAVCLS